VLYQNDDFGKDYLKGLEDGLAGKLPIIAQVAYALTGTSLDAPAARLRNSGADTLFDVTPPKFAAQATCRVAQIGWHPEHVITSVSESVGAVLKPAGLENAEGLLSAYAIKEPTIPIGTMIPAIPSGLASWRSIFPTPAGPTASPSMATWPRKP
jgi:branched-chain amino acid transport system substrate-binding protein